jgi:DNA-binding response OmpR family regulator
MVTAESKTDNVIAAKRASVNNYIVKPFNVATLKAKIDAVFIRATAEDAAGRILDSAEGLLAFADKEEANKAEEAILAIMTACGFHDLVGQRVTKIAESLDRVITTKRAAGAGKAAGAAPKRKSPVLEGPGLPGASEQDQARIDALFRDN